MPSQLYEVDVFMFFLKDLEAVSNNFYHDLWQVARLHTPKVTAPFVPQPSNPACYMLEAVPTHYCVLEPALGNAFTPAMHCKPVI